MWKRVALDGAKRGSDSKLYEYWIPKFASNVCENVLVVDMEAHRPLWRENTIQIVVYKLPP